MTADVDVTVDVAQTGTLALLKDLSHAGFDLRIDLGDDFLRETRLLPLVHRPTCMPPEATVFRSPDEWSKAFAAARVHVQWDTERNLRGGPLPCYSIQVGIGRDLIREYAESWVVSIEDRTPLVRKMYQQLQAGHADSAAQLLPRERPYAVDETTARRLLIDP